MGKFNFKVGDNVKLSNWKETVLEITAIGKEYFLATNEGVESFFDKKLDWQPHQEPKQKQKLQKFYCGTTDELIYPEYWETKEEALKNRKNVYTEAEFLEKFDVEI